MELVKQDSSLAPLVGLLTKCALLCAALLLASNLPFVSTRAHAWLSSLPLALAGIAYALLQIHLRPSRRTLLKRLLLAASFIFWAIDQLLPSGRLATFIGDAVISAYVLDLLWIIQEQGERGESATPRSLQVVTLPKRVAPAEDQQSGTR
jgi:hypothetical protein